jgi:hypothetical protein
VATIRPLKLLFLTPIVTLMALYVAITYGILYLLFTTFSFVYSDKYGFGEGVSGLSYIPAGLGMMIGVVVFGQITDAMVRSRQEKGIAHKAEIRLSPILTIPCGLTLPVGLFIYGWTTQYAVHWIVPMIGVVIFTCGLMGVMVRFSCFPVREKGVRFGFREMIANLPFLLCRCPSRTTCSTATRSTPLR